jgi:16S rRNA (adenine1518-N6/adenine1519-N6)-dimethyltransferase
VLHRPKKSLGQNFLRDPSYVERIVAALNLTRHDVVIEIGAGQGALTEGLVESGARVVAIEFDRDLVDELNVRFESSENFSLVNADALNADLPDLVHNAGKDLAKLIANLPYNISTPILQRLISSREVFSEIVLMFQREVVTRITAPAGDGERGFLTVLVENAFVAKPLFDVPPEAFYPRPKVWSSVVRLVPREPLISNHTMLRKLVSSAFNQKRKTLQNSLKGIIDDPRALLGSAEIDPNRRAQTLTLEEWAMLVKAAE